MFHEPHAGADHSTRLLPSGDCDSNHARSYHASACDLDYVSSRLGVAQPAAEVASPLARLTRYKHVPL